MEKKRFFKIGEKVFNCDPMENDNFDFGKILLINGKEEDGYVDEDTIVTLAMLHNDFLGENECYGDNIYKIVIENDSRWGTICYEHHKDIDYPFYSPEYDENMYGRETDTIKTYHYSKETLEELYEQCLEYYHHENDIEQRKEYLRELGELCDSHTPNDREELMRNVIFNSGLFHDAIGKLIDVSDNYIYIETEY